MFVKEVKIHDLFVKLLEVESHCLLLYCNFTNLHYLEAAPVPPWDTLYTLCHFVIVPVAQIK